MAALGVNIKYVTNLAKQIDDLNKFGDQIVATTAGAAKLANTLGGGKLLQSANNLAAAIDKIGGVSKLTASEQERWLPLLDKAIAKYEALGQTAPSSLRDIASQMR